jgi:dTDP-4-dehydrorhamnose reductase
MKILVVGQTGQVGWELQRTLSNLGTVIAVGQPVIQLTNPDSIRGVIRRYAPELIINAAAYTAVDKAEDQPDLAMKINGIAPAIMAEEAKLLGAAFVTFSTDYVFNGGKQGSYTESDVPNPICEYGRTKLAGDLGVEAIGGSSLILRTSWVYGSRGSNFLLTMLRLAGERNELKVVDDQVGAPTWSRAIAEATGQIVAQVIAPRSHGNSRATLAELFADHRGVYNVTAAGAVSWFGFTQEILTYARPDDAARRPLLLPIPSAQYPTRAKRPQNSLLDNTKLQQTFGIALPEWSECLCLVMQDLGYASKESKTAARDRDEKQST